MKALASARLIVPIAAEEKQRVEAKAKAHKISAAEFMRRAALNYDPDSRLAEEEAELAMLVAAFRQSHGETLAQLDRADAALDRALAHFAAKGAP